MTVVRQRVIEIERQGSSKHKPYGCVSMSATRQMKGLREVMKQKRQPNKHFKPY